MGFLDFLKKKDEQLPPPPKDAFVPPPPQDPQDEIKEGFDDIPAPTPEMKGFSDEDLFAPPKGQDFSIPPPEPAKKAALEPSTPELPSWEPEERGPEPEAPKKPAQAPLPKKPARRADPLAPEPAKKAPLEIPDFTDDEIQSVRKKPKIPEPKYLPEEWAPPKDESQEEIERERAEIRKITDTIRPRESLEPAHPTNAFGSLEPAEFVSSDTYFAIQEEIKGIRKVLRESDAKARSAGQKHEQADAIVEKFAIEINNIQEQLIELDESLFG